MPNRIELQDKGQGYHKDQYSGKAQGPGTSHKGISRTIRNAKRQEAEARNSHTHPDNRRVHWKAQGFARKSEAARIIRQAVAEGTVISKTIIPED